MALKRYDGTPIIQDRNEWVAQTLGMPVIQDQNNWPSYNFIEQYNNWRPSLPYNSFKYLEGGVGFTDSLKQKVKQATDYYHNYYQNQMDQMQNNPGALLSQYSSGQAGPEKLSFTQKYNNLSSGTRAGIQAGASIGGNILYNWASGNRRTNAGSALNSIGDAAIATGNPYAIIGGVAAKGLGVLANRAFGNDPKAMQRYSHHINSMMSQDFSGDPVAAVNNSMSGIDIRRKDFGWGNLGDYHNAKSAMDFAEKRADLSGQHAIYKWDKKMLNDNLSTHYALGGLLETDTPIGYSMAVQQTVNDRMKQQDRGFMPKNIFAEGGTAGLNLDDGISYIGNGGSHEENLYGGVPQGVAPDGQPNLVEEGEYKVKLKDGEEMFSERLTVPQFKRQKGEQLSKAQKIANKYHTERGRTFAQAIRKAMHDTGYEEGENDPISQSGFFDVAENLKIIQDQERAKQQLGDQASEIANMTPEEFAQQQEMEKQQQMAQLQQEQMEQQAAQQQAMQQQGMPEQGIPQGQMPPEQMMQQSPMGYMGAYGGHLFGEGDTLGFANVDDFFDLLKAKRIPWQKFLAWYNNLPEDLRRKFEEEALAKGYFKDNMRGASDNPSWAIQGYKGGQKVLNPIAGQYYLDNYQNIGLPSDNIPMTALDFEDELERLGKTRRDYFNWMYNQSKADRDRWAQEALAMDYLSSYQGTKLNDDYLINNPLEREEAELLSIPAANAYLKSLGVQPRQSQQQTAQRHYDDEDYKKARTKLNSFYRENNITKDKLDPYVVDAHLRIIMDNPDLKGAQLQERILGSANLQGVRGRNNRAIALNNATSREMREQFLFDDGATSIRPVNGKFKHIWSNGEFKPISPIDGLTYDEKNKIWSLGNTPLDLGTEENRKLFQSQGNRTTTTSGIDINKYQQMYRDAIEQRFKEREGDKYDPNRLANYYLSNDELRQWINDLAEGKVSLEGYTPEELKTLSGLIGNIWTDNLDENGLPIEQDWYRKQYADVGKRTDHKPGIMHIPYEEGATETVDNIRGKVGRLKLGEDKYAYIPYSTDNPYYTFSKDPTAMGNLDVYDVTGGNNDYNIGVLPDGRYVLLTPEQAGKIKDYQIDNEGQPTFEDDPLGYTHSINYYDLSKKDDPYKALGWSGPGDPFPKPSDIPFWAAIGLQGASTLYNVLTPTDYSNANAMINAAKQAGRYMPVSFTPQGTYERYKPTPDMENEIFASTAGLNRSIMNAGLNPGQEMAGMLANNKTGIEAAGKNRLDTASTNQQQKLAVVGINNDINKFNSEGMLKADMANQDAYSKAMAASLQGTMAGYRLKEEIAQNKANAINAGLTGLANLLYTMNTNKYNQELLGWGMRNRVWDTIRGITPTDNTKPAAYGGTINNKKKSKRRKNGLTF